MTYSTTADLCAQCYAARPPLPGSLLADVTDDQLRAECERRGLRLNATAWREMRAERDEWKRRAEAAERMPTPPPTHAVEMATLRDELASAHRREAAAQERVAHLTARIDGGYVPRIARLMRLNERGPGIAAMKPDTERWGPSDEDLLCEDV